MTDIQDDQCRALVKQYQALAAQDVRFDVPLADACYDDRQRLCAHVAPVRVCVCVCVCVSVCVEGGLGQPAGSGPGAERQALAL